MTGGNNGEILYQRENWPECTDPSKFVHEDLGIASYLLLLWKGRKCNFIDLGCGNGLLVYLLSEEGHCGLGLDVRKRKIWSTYPATTHLKEETVIPSSSSVYPDADWLIGNHSDELTAWLPIMAAKSNPHCQYFTIPCCPYKLNGAKFQRRNSSISIYQDFLRYNQEVGELCGFKVTADKMKIPSTKRICLIGRRMQDQAAECIQSRMQAFIDGECVSGQVANGSDAWIGDFKPRMQVEPVRNCTRVPKSVQDAILKEVMTQLLTLENNVGFGNGKFWNKGATLQISEIAGAIAPELLSKLRLECKGLQTLLKNHHQVFEVKGGTVSLRDPSSLSSMSSLVRSRKEFKWKQKECWFHTNHPQGCPVPEDECSYKHTVILNNVDY